MQHTFDVAIKGVTGLPTAAQLLVLGLHAPAQRYLRYQFPGAAGPHMPQSLCTIAPSILVEGRARAEPVDAAASIRQTVAAYELKWRADCMRLTMLL